MFTSGPFLIFIAAILWGLDGILRRSLYSLPPITIVFLEHLIGLVLIAPFFIRAFKKEKLAKNEWWAIGLVSLFSSVLGTLFFTTALAKVGFIAFSVVFFVQKLQPIFTVATASIVLKEKVSKQYLLWAGLALVAGYFVTFPGGVINFAEGKDHLMAALFAFLAAVAWGSTTAFSRYTLLGHSNTFITGMRFLITVPLALIGVFLLGSSSSLAQVTPGQYGYLFAIALSTGLVALWIYYKGLKKTPASVSAIVELAFPVTAIFIDYFLYDTTLAWSQYVAVAVLLFCAYKVAGMIRGGGEKL